TLFNRLSVNVKSLTLNQEGVTRDFLKDVVCWQDRCFDLIDTGGISLRKTKDPLLKKLRERLLFLIDEATIILFVCDGTIGLLSEDREIAKLLHKKGKQVLLLINKNDVKVAQEQLHEFGQIGFKLILPISAQHGIGIGDVLEELVTLLPQTKPVNEELSYRVVILGKPNVGKSSLMNILLKQERALVSEKPGTTREALIEKIRFYQEDIQVADTPGIRRKRVITEKLEDLMVQSAFRAVREADIVLLMVDAAEGRIADQELKLAFYVFEQQHKALIILFNKQDLVVDPFIKERLAFSLEEYKYFMDKVAQLTISCKTKKNIGKILPLVKKVWQRCSQWFSDEELTRICKEALLKKPLYRQKKLLMIYSVQQVATAPLTILLKVNESKWFGPSQLGFFDNILRRTFDLKGVPIRFLLRKKNKKD
ncbi:MAG: ribosome biogenesis GTPase Der, partial [Candidatus Babeliales bacterium]